MKSVVKLALAASLVAGASAQRHQHQHRHQHPKKHEHGSPVLKREVVTEYAPGPVATAYVYDNGETVDAAEAKQCLSKGSCVVVGSSVPTYSPEAPPPPPSSTSNGAQFYEQKSTAAPAAPTAYPVSGGSGLDANFPSGEVPCNTFPSQYGPIAVPWMNLDGWVGIQDTGGWTPGLAISNIVQPITGPCPPGSFCQYACPPGYISAQWPVDSQGATGQSIGGVFCNANGKLELTNPDFKTLCKPGVGGITVKNETPGSVAVCATNYPGTENMNIPTLTDPGTSLPLTNPDAATGYKWQGKFTSRQYYVNKLNVAPEDACVWESPKYPGASGNFAPINIGAGEDINGITYMSIFPNHPSSTAELDFDIVIQGDITAPCEFVGGVYTNGGNGCTVSILSEAHRRGTRLTACRLPSLTRAARRPSSSSQGPTKPSDPLGPISLWSFRRPRPGDSSRSTGPAHLVMSY